MHSRIPAIPFLLVCLVASFAASALAQSTSSIDSALANASRPEVDRVRDKGRKPADVLKLISVREGDTVLDVGSGGGYYAELLSGLVGGSGTVFAQNPFLVLGVKSLAAPMLARYGSGRLENVVLLIGNLGRVGLAANSVDAILFVDTYHDISFSSETGEAPSKTATQLLEELKRVLKPGGSIVVIDHAARVGASRFEAAKIHRVPEATLRADFEHAGFKFEKSSDFLRNTSDDRDKAWFADPILSDNTDRFIHRYVKSSGSRAG